MRCIELQLGFQSVALVEKNPHAGFVSEHWFFPAHELLLHSSGIVRQQGPSGNPNGPTQLLVRWSCGRPP